MIYFTSSFFSLSLYLKMLTSFTWLKNLSLHHPYQVIHSNVLQGRGSMIEGGGMLTGTDGWEELWNAVFWTWRCLCNEKHMAALGLHMSDLEEQHQQQWEKKGKRENNGWQIWSEYVVYMHQDDCQPTSPSINTLTHHRETIY